MTDHTTPTPDTLATTWPTKAEVERWRWIGADGCPGGEHNNREDVEDSMHVWDSAYPVNLPSRLQRFTADGWVDVAVSS